MVLVAFRADKMPAPSGGIQIVWEDDFSSTEKEKLTSWIEGVFQTIDKTIGPYPFVTNIYLHRSTRGGEPVPWAHTIRDKEQGIAFHVNPEFSLQEFAADWTAPHELSHLSLPFLGKENMWFAEGYASFMQWYLLAKQGVCSEADANEKYQKKLEAAAPFYQSEKPFVVVNAEMKNQHNYPAVYWGGASYFFQVNQLLLTEKKTTLFAIIQRYQSEARMNDQSLEELISSLDGISESQIFSTLLAKFQSGKANEVFKSSL